MRKLCVATLVIALVSGVASAQAPSATTVLANVQQHYANAKHLTAKFKQTVTVASFGTTKTSDGQLWVAKPSSFRLDYMTARRNTVVVTKSFISNGTTLWSIDHTNKQIVQTQLQSSALPVVFSFLTGVPAQVTAAIDTSGTYGVTGDVVLVLTPNQPSSQFERLYLVTDPSDWHVNASVVIDPNHNTNQFAFFMQDAAAASKASWFQVSPASLPTYKLVQPTQAPAAATPTP